MNTFILMWNPAISSVKMEEFENYIEDPTQGMNWSVWDHKALSHGDRYFLVKVGEGNTGIVASGEFIGEAWQDADWFDKGREVYCADMYALSIIHPDHKELFTTEELQAAIPDFDWTGGHSGRLLTDEQATRLEVLWMEHLLKIAANHKTDEMGDICEDKIYISSESFEPSSVLNEWLHQQRGRACEVCGYDYKKLFGEECDWHNAYRIIKNVSKGCTLDDFHCMCSNCMQVETFALKVIKDKAK